MSAIGYELLYAELGKYIVNKIPLSDFNYGKVTEQRAVKILDEIQVVLYQHEQVTDFEVVDAIVDIFVKYNLDIGSCHDW